MIEQLFSYFGVLFGSFVVICLAITALLWLLLPLMLWDIRSKLADVTSELKQIKGTAVHMAEIYESNHDNVD